MRKGVSGGESAGQQGCCAAQEAGPPGQKRTNRGQGEG